MGVWKKYHISCYVDAVSQKEFFIYSPQKGGENVQEKIVQGNHSHTYRNLAFLTCARIPVGQ